MDRLIVNVILSMAAVNEFRLSRYGEVTPLGKRARLKLSVDEAKQLLWPSGGSN